jgi:hypothetical protein
VLVAGKSPAKVQPEILEIFFLGESHISLHVVNVMFADLGPLAFILHFFKPVLDCSSVKQWVEHCPWLVLQYSWQRLLWCIVVRLVGLQCIVGIIRALGHFLGVHQH